MKLRRLVLFLVLGLCRAFGTDQYTHLTVCSNHNTLWLFDTSNEITYNFPAGPFGPTSPPSWTLTVTGGSGWTTGVYTISSYLPGFATQSGTHNMVRVQGNAAGNTPAALGATGGTGWITPNQPDTTIHSMLVFAGNSLTNGENATSYFTSYPNDVVGLLATPGVTWDFANIGVDGYTIANMQSAFATQALPRFDPGKRSVLIAWEFTNSLKSLSAATALANFETYCQGAMNAGFQVIVVTVDPRIVEAGDQPPSFEANRQTVNTALRAACNVATANANVWLAAPGTTWCTAMADVANDPNIGQPGDQTNTTYYAGDQIHLTDLGYSIVATYVSAAINLLPAQNKTSIVPNRGPPAVVIFTK